jgi:GNAT superfamily N-acetyltransferase
VPTQQDIPRLLALRETRRRGGLARNQNAALTEIERRFQQIAEPAAAMATGMLAEPVSGIVGMAALPFGADVAANAVRNTQQGLTYQPRTEAGQQGMQALQGFMQPIAETVSRQTDIASKVLAGNAGFDVNTPGGQFLTGMLPALAASAPGFTAARAIPGRQLEMGDIGAGGVGSRQRGAVGGIRSVNEPVTSTKGLMEKFKGEGIDSFISEKAKNIVLNKIVVPDNARSSGLGSRAMQDLTDYADKSGKRIDLTPSADFGGNKKRLTEFYKRFGFVENKGKNKDYEVSESMYRPASKLDINEPATVKPDQIRALKNQDLGEVGNLQMDDVAEYLDEGMSLRAAIREADVESLEVRRAIREAYPPKIVDEKNIPKDSYEIEIFDAEPEEFGGLLDAAQIDRFYVNDGFKGSGIARSALVSEIKKQLSKNPKKEIVLLAEPLDDTLSSIELVDFYESVGFKVMDDGAGMSGVPMLFDGFPKYIE